MCMFDWFCCIFLKKTSPLYIHVESHVILRIFLHRLFQQNGMEFKSENFAFSRL